MGKNINTFFFWFCYLLIIFHRAHILHSLDSSPFVVLPLRILHLGSGLRNWVFIPITIIIICVSLLMKYLSYIFNQGSKKVIQSDTKNVDNLDFNAEMGKRALDMKIKNAVPQICPPAI